MVAALILATHSEVQLESTQQAASQSYDFFLLTNKQTARPHGRVNYVLVCQDHWVCIFQILGLTSEYLFVTARTLFCSSVHSLLNFAVRFCPEASSTQLALPVIKYAWCWGQGHNLKGHLLTIKVLGKKKKHLQCSEFQPPCPPPCCAPLLTQPSQMHWHWNGLWGCSGSEPSSTAPYSTGYILHSGSRGQLNQ